MSDDAIRARLDRLWTEFWTGGITNPLTVIEQITYLLFCRMLDEAELRRERAARHGAAFSPLFRPEQRNLRWSAFRRLGGEEMLLVVRDHVFPFLRSLGGEAGPLAGMMRDAQLLIVKPALLASAVAAIDSLDLRGADAKGDLYEHLLSKLGTAGINGQFRTPRHIQEAMVRMAAPKPTEVIGDPACGTAGFLVKCLERLRREHSSPELVVTDLLGRQSFPGDLLEPHAAHIRDRMFRGFDFDATMLRLSAMNMFLHGVEGRCIFHQDSLAESFPKSFPAEAAGHFDLILANPPFKGSLDRDGVDAALIRQVKTTKTELLFLVRMLGMLKQGGRCLCIVPDGVLFGTGRAHVAVRKILAEENQLEAVISLPAGVFKPYAGVSTAILVFVRGGRTRNVFFFDVRADGFSLDDKRIRIDDNDLPELIRRWEARDPEKDTDRSSQAFFVPLEDIRAQDYDLGMNRYRTQVHEDEDHEPPADILRRMIDLEAGIAADLEELRRLAG